MIDVKKLLIDIYRGERDIESLSDEERLLAMTGLRSVSEVFMQNEKTEALGRKIAGIIDAAMKEDDEEDPFADAIVEAESRGAIYLDFGDDFH